MDETNQPDEQRKDPADVLADMATGQDEEIVAPPESTDEPEGDPHDALTRMADGEIEEADPQEAPAAPAEPDLDEALAGATGLAGRQAFQARQARASALSAQQARATHHAYKRTMIPLLLIVGLLLIVVGVLSSAMLIWHRGEGMHDTALAAVTLVSFPLSAILLFGAWWFRRDVKGP